MFSLSQCFYEDGLKEGIEQGIDKMNRLVLSLIQAGRQDDIEKRQRIKSIGISCIRNMG